MEMPSKFRVVSATRASRDDFFRTTALGRSLSLLPSPLLEVRVFEQNVNGLPTVYNQAIEESAGDPAIMVFAHDDVHLCDFFWAARIATSLRQFDIVGLAGNRRRVPAQPAWAFADTSFTWDSPENLRGAVGHGKGFPPEEVRVFGPPGEASLLDGLLIACPSTTLQRSGLRFDEQFDFHFYDMDFCRQAESKGLRMGTCMLSVVHESVGSFGGRQWWLAYEKYLRKWGR